MSFPNQILKQKNSLKNMLKIPRELNSYDFLYDSFDFIKNCEVVESRSGLSDENDKSRVFTNIISLRNRNMIHFKNNLKTLLFLMWHEGNKHSKKKSQSNTFFWSRSSHISVLFGNFDQCMQATNSYGSLFECRMTIQHEYQSSWLSSPVAPSSLLLPFLFRHEEDRHEKESHTTLFYWSHSSHIAGFNVKFDPYMQSTNYYGSLFECKMTIRHEYEWLSSHMTLSSVLLPFQTTDNKNVDSHTADNKRWWQKHVIATNKESLSENKVKQTTSRKCIPQTTQVKRKFKPSQKDFELKNSVNADKYNQQQLFSIEFLAFILVVLVSFPATDASRIHFPSRDTKPAKVLSAKILFSEECAYQNFRCPTEARNLPLLLKQCGFTDICPPGYKPICVNARERAVIICSESNLTCDAGFHRTAVLDDNMKDTVVISEEMCPVGTYQPTPSDCYNACYSQHRTFLPERYLIHTTGDNVNPTFVYCNYNIGYINLEGNLLIDFDEEEEHDQYFCQLVNKGVYCNGKHDMFPLPNGTCVSSCANGEFRDDFDDFACKKIISKSIDTTKAHVLSTDIVRKDLNSSSTTALVSHAEGDEGKGHADKPNSTKTNANGDVIIAGGIVAGVLLIIGAIALVIYCVQHKNRNGENVINTRTLNQNCVTYNVLADAETGTVNFMNANSDVSDVAITRTSSGDTGFPSHGSEFDQSPDEVSTESGTSESGYLEERNGQQVHDLVGVEAIRQPNMAEEDSEETECKTPYLPQITGVATPVNVVKPMERQYDCRMKLLKDFEE